MAAIEHHTHRPARTPQLDRAGNGNRAEVGVSAEPEYARQLAGVQVDGNLLVQYADGGDQLRDHGTVLAAHLAHHFLRCAGQQVEPAAVERTAKLDRQVERVAQRFGQAPDHRLLDLLGWDPAACAWAARVAVSWLFSDLFAGEASRLGASMLNERRVSKIKTGGASQDR